MNLAAMNPNQTRPPLARILFIHGGVGGDQGNSVELGRALAQFLGDRATVAELFLSQNLSNDEIVGALEAADAFVFTTGTYWDSWGSPLQRFLEEFTRLEGTSVYLGKPAAVLVTMHSVGGKEVLSRLQGVLNTLGMSIPPMSGIAYSYSTQLALTTPVGKTEADFWSFADLERIAHNLMTAVAQNRTSDFTWSAWNIDTSNPNKKWISAERS